MYISIDTIGRVPAYMQIYHAIKIKITAGAFPAGSKLPSKRTLAADCGVSVATVEHAYSLLCEEGFCESRERSGCYAVYSPEKNFPAAEVQDFAPAEISSGDDTSSGAAVPFTAFAARMRRVLSDHGEKILMKSPNNGCTQLRDAICRYLVRSRNITVSPEQVIIGSGAESLYGLIIQMLGRDRMIALEDPSYEKIKAVYTANGAECDMLSMDSEGIKISELERTCASVLHVTPFHSFPSGITASAARREEYLRWAGERSAVIIEDDYDSESIVTGEAPETLFSMCRSGRVIYVNTFSRTIAPSIRAGYMLLPENMLGLYREKIGFYSCTVPMLEQYFLADWIDSGDFERNINRMRKKFSAGQE